MPQWGTDRGQVCALQESMKALFLACQIRRWKGLRAGCTSLNL